jgi:NADPH-dependent 2,4-dienoyl-CoA reductase/sulfur reductase-like enzyme
MAMHSYEYLVVGGGMTGDAVTQGIRQHDETGTIGLVGEESHAPYKRPPLTKGLWSGGDEAKIWRKTDERGVALHLGRRIVSLDLANRRAVDDVDDEYAYEKLVLATGGTPRRLGDDDDSGVVYYRTLDDYRHVRALADRGASFVVIGGGFIGSEIAASLRSNGCEVTMAFPESGIGWRNFPPELSAAVTEEYRNRGVEVLTDVLVAGVEREGERTRVRLEDGRTLEAVAVVAGLGIVPRTDLAEAAGLPVEDGIVVDEQGRVAGFDGVFAAGDVARFPLVDLRRSGRVEHEDHALSHGKLVGANAAGAGARYEQLPFFYSDLFDFGYEAVGEVNSRHRTVEAWKDPNRKGVVAFVDDDGRPRGVLLWGIFDKVDDARALIGAGEPVDEAKLRELAG